ncbi:MAG: hypothetical protein GX591_00925 [Planctomycetes bacterium]|nr:hypothetical protein [Planctomycetota bacterium]
MNKKILSMIAAVVLTGAVASADTSLFCSVGELNLSYSVATGGMVITSGTSSSMDVWKLGASPVEHLALLESAVTGMYTLDMVFTQFAANDWRATGTLTLKDVNQEVVKGSFVSSNVYIDPNAGVLGSGSLVIKGSLSPISPNDGVLVPSVYGWDITNGTDTIHFNNATSFDTGSVVNTEFLFDPSVFPVKPVTLDEFFTGMSGSMAGWNLVDGDSQVTITPVPAGVLLGLIGLGMVGARMRKYA